MTREQLARELQAIEAALADRITVVRAVIDMHHTVIATYRRTVVLHRDSHTRESHSGGQK